MEPVPVYFFLKSKRDGDVVDVSDASRVAGTALIAYPPKTSGTGNQSWEFVLSDSPPYFFIASKQTGEVIDIKDAKQAAGTPLVAYPQKASGTDNQLWMLVPSDKTEQYFFITSKLQSGVITVQGPKKESGTPLVVSPRKTSETDNQLWSLVRSG